MTTVASDLAFVPVISVAAVRRLRFLGERFLTVSFAALVWEPNDLHELLRTRPVPHLVVRLLDNRE